MIKSIHKKSYKKFLKIVGRSNDKTSKYLFYIFEFAIVISALLLLIDIAFRNIDATSTFKLGEFGDFYGGVLNPILTFLMFIGLLITIVMQKNELTLTRDEYKRTSDALSDQAKTAQKQSFESTFFNLLQNHNNITNSLVFDDRIICSIINRNNESTTGRMVFYSILRWMSDDDDSDFLEYYTNFNQTENHIVGHYFRNLYQILKFIDSSNLDDEDKISYSRIIRAQLSADELALLYFNCICHKVDQGHFLDYVKRYSFLEHLRLEKTEYISNYCVSSVTVYTSKEHLLKYIDFDDFGNVKHSAFGENPTARECLY